MLTVLSTILGALTSSVPSLLKMFDRNNELKHQREMARIQLEAAKKNVELQVELENVKALANEGESLRTHDASLDGGVFINALRASVRPLITYVFFILFVIVKISAVSLLIQNGLDVKEILPVIWDEETASLFSAILGFWFGSRVIDKLNAK